MKKFSSGLLLSFIAIIFSAFVIYAADPSVSITSLSPAIICANGNDTLIYSVSASNIPANTNVVVYQSTDSSFNPSLGQGDSIGFLKGDTTSTSIITSTCPKILGIFIDACNDSGRLEPANEYMVITSGQGFLASNLKIDLPNTNLRDINTGSNPCTFGTPSNTLMTLLRTGFCNSTNLIAASQADSIPPNALVIVFTGAGTDYPYNLSRFCQTGQKVYVLQNACTNGSGAFVNNDAAGTSCNGASATTRYRTTTLSNRNCFDELTYDRCGLNEFDGANPNANDGNYVIRLQSTDTSSVANGGIQNNAADRCNGIVLDSIIKTKTLKYAIPTVFCNTGIHYIKAILKPGTIPVTLSNTIQYKYVCNDVRTSTNTQNICSGQNAVINISSTDPNATFSWTVSGGANITGASSGTGNQINQTLIYAGATNDNITYNITSADAGCNKTTSVNVVVNKCDTCNLVPVISGNTKVCNGVANTLTVAGQYDSVRWNTGANTTSINVSQAGNYAVTVYLGACSGTANTDVTAANVSVRISGEDIICGGTTGTLTASGQFDSLRWNTGASTTAITVTQEGNYSVTAYSNGCSATSNFNVGRISIYYSLDKKFDTICPGDTAKFVLSAGDLGVAPVDTFYYTQPGKYIITYQTPICGVFTDSVTVVEKTIPKPTITGNLTICSGTSTTLDAGSNYDSYVWQPNGELTQAISVNTPATYSVTVKTGNCSSNNSLTVSVTNPPAVFSLGNDTAFCGSFSKILSAGNQSAIWSTGVTAAQITITEAGTYIATITNDCGSVSDTIVITQNALPVVFIGNDTAFCEGELILSINEQQDIKSVLWNTGAQTASITVTTIGIYSVKVSNNNGCSDSDVINISSNCANEIWLPNAFTPDGNGVNDVFYVRGNPRNVTIERFVIYNRWGNKVFESYNTLPDDITAGWNGYFKNKIEQLEVYGYEVRVVFANGEKRTLKGNVTLLK